MSFASLELPQKYKPACPRQKILLFVILQKPFFNYSVFKVNVSSSFFSPGMKEKETLGEKERVLLSSCRVKDYRAIKNNTNTKRRTEEEGGGREMDAKK